MLPDILIFYEQELIPSPSTAPINIFSVEEDRAVAFAS